MKPEYITIHNTANDASAENEIAYMIRNDNAVSYHFAVDDKGAVQGLPLDRNAWHAGDGADGKGNRKSIGIEICYSKSGGERFNKAYQNAIELTAQLMKQFNIPASNIMFHQSWNGKYCPHRLLDMRIDVKAFRAVAQQKYNEMYERKVINVKETTTTTKKDNTPDTYAKEAIDWAVKKGILVGSNGDYKLHSNVTRQDVLVFLYRALN
jgi:N-acetylmuramoyl-L-alanine amidase CwlA